MSRVFLALVCAAFTTACATSNAPSQSASGGAGVDSGGDAGGSAGGHCACASTEVCCLGQTLTCVAPGSCQGIPVVESCSVPSDCDDGGADGGVCCSTFLGPDGGPLALEAFDGVLGHGMAGPSGFGSISTECKAAAACGSANGASFQVCIATVKCPIDLTCQSFPRSPLGTQYCLPTATSPDGGTTSDAALRDAFVAADASDSAASLDASAPADASAGSDVSAPNDGSPQDAPADGG
jgi:hypothetical protein